MTDTSFYVERRKYLIESEDLPKTVTANIRAVDYKIEETIPLHASNNQDALISFNDGIEHMDYASSVRKVSGQKNQYEIIQNYLLQKNKDIVIEVASAPLTPSADQIRHIRKLTGLSQAAFSKKFRIPFRTICDWEAGKRTPPNYVLRMLRYQIEFELPRNKK